MFSRPAVVLFALAVAELFVLTRIASAIGAGPAVLALILLSVTGIVLFWRGGARFLAASVDRVTAAGVQKESVVADRAMVVFGALLLIVPGFLTGLIGILLLVPPIRTLVRPVVLHRIQPWIQPNLQFRQVRWFGRDVVDVDIIDVDDAPNENQQTQRPELS